MRAERGTPFVFLVFLAMLGATGTGADSGATPSPQPSDVPDCARIDPKTPGGITTSDIVGHHVRGGDAQGFPARQVCYFKNATTSGDMIFCGRIEGYPDLTGYCISRVLRDHPSSAKCDGLERRTRDLCLIYYISQTHDVSACRLISLVNRRKN